MSRQISETPKSVTNVTLWVYKPPAPRQLALRNAPTLLASAKTKTEIAPGKEFWVVDMVEGEDGMFFLKVDLRPAVTALGWVFDRHPDHGVLCKQVDLITMAFLPEQERAGFKIAFPNAPAAAATGGCPSVTAVSSQEARKAGLRAGDRIVRVDGQWVREKQSARAALQSAVSLSRLNSRPMTLEIYRPDGEEDDEEADGPDEDPPRGVTADHSPLATPPAPPHPHPKGLWGPPSRA